MFCLSRKSNKSCKNRLKVPKREGFPPIILASFFKFIHVNVSAIHMSGIIYLTKVRVSALLLYWEKNREKMCEEVEY